MPVKMMYVLFLPQIINRNIDNNKMAPLPLASCMDVDSGSSMEGGSYLINRLFTEGWQDCTNLHQDVQTDAYKTGDVIARRMTFVAQKYPYCPDALTWVCLGVVLLISAREIEVFYLARPPPSFGW